MTKSVSVKKIKAMIKDLEADVKFDVGLAKTYIRGGNIGKALEALQYAQSTNLAIIDMERLLECGK